MTKRLSYPNVWAQDGTATDPDLDTTHPSYLANRYRDIGWKAEKPPEFWQNFLTQISDQKIVSLLFDGVAYWDASVAYQLSAICKYNNVVWIKVTNTSPATAPGATGSDWDSVVDGTASGFNSIVANLNSKLSNHLAASNPHNDTVNTLTDKSYVKTDVDNFFGSATDPRTIVYHKNITGVAAHLETPAQVGTLPASGGTFSGPVVMSKSAILALSPTKLVRLNPTTAIFELTLGSTSIGIDGAGNCFVVNSEGTWPIMTEAMYDAFQKSWNNRFALPAPILDMNLKSSASDPMSVGTWTISGTSDFVFNSVGGGIKVNDNTLSFTDFQINVPVTLAIVARDASNNIISAIKDWSTAKFNNMSSLLTNAGLGSTAVYVERITCYPGYLTNYQKSMLVQ